MVSKEIDPSDIGKFPKLIQAAQKDMAQADVLVCGICHTVFHFIELFEEHKQDECTRDSHLKDSRETKPKVWAFLLWKAAQLNNSSMNQNIGEKGKESTMNSWKLYQTWIKQDEAVRETWIVAGRTIQSFARMGQGTLQEMPVKITKTVVDQAPISPAPTVNRIGQQTQRIPFNKISPKTDDDDKLKHLGTSDGRKILRPVSGAQTQGKLSASTPITKIVSGGISRKGKRTLPGTTDQFHDATVEKIVAKRFNPRRNHHEYLVKWDGFTHDQNTWEPQTHLDTCPQLLDTFEKQLARQKEQRAAQERAKALATAALKPDDKKIASSTPAVTGQIIIKSSDNRIKSPDNGVKRKLDESSDTGNNTTEDDFEEDSIPIHSVKRLKNGIAVTTKPNEIKSPPLSKLINGLPHLKSNSLVDTSAEVVITKDPSGAGIVRKNNTSSPSANNLKPEAQIRVLSKGENTASGIVRIGSNSSSPVTPSSSPSSSVLTNHKLTNNTAGTPVSGNRQLPTRAVLPTLKNQSGATQQRMTLANKTQPQTQTPQYRPLQRNVSPQVRLQPQPQAKVNSVQRPVTTQVVNNVNAINSNSTANRMVTRKSALQSPTVQHSKVVQPPHQRQIMSQANVTKNRMVTRALSPQKSITSNAINSTTNHNSNNVTNNSNGSNSSDGDGDSGGGGIQLCPVTGKILSETGEEIPQPLEVQEQETALQLAEGITIDGQQLITNEDGTPLLVTGEDGTIYQVAGKNADGQTILIAQGEDGQQHFAYVAATEGEQHDTTEGVLTLENVVSEAVSQQLVASEQHITIEDSNSPIDTSQALTIQTDGSVSQGSDQDANIPAEVVQADLPSPGGTRRVILMLQDGTFMMTEMHDDEYQALNIT